MFRYVIAILGILVLAATAQAKTIKLATLAPKGSPWHEILLDMVAEWEAANGGTLDVRVYPGGVLGDELDTMRKLAIGQIDGAMVTGTGLARLVPDMWVFAMPRMVRTYPEIDLLRAEIGPELKAQFWHKGYVVLNWGDAGWIRFFSNAPVVSPDDLRKLRLFTWAGDDILLDAWRRERFHAIPLPATELFPALQSGMVDAYLTTPVASLSFQWFGMAPYMLDLNWAPLVGATILRRADWEEIPEAARAKMLVSAERAGERLRERTRVFEEEAVSVMVAHGLTVTPVTPAALEAWEEGARGASEVIRKKYVSPDLAIRVQRLLGEYRSGLAKADAVN